MLRKIGLMMLILGTAVSAGAEDAPDSKNALAKRIGDYHHANNCDGFINLFYQQGKDTERRAAFVMTITNYVCANFSRKVTSIAFQDIDEKKLAAPKDFKGARSEYTLKPVGAVVIDYGDVLGPTPGETSSLSLLYGVQDGKYYLITTKAADK